MRAGKRCCWSTLILSLLFAMSLSGVAQAPKDLAWQTLSDGARNKDARTRATAIRSLGMVACNDVAEKQVTESLSDPVAEVRIAAATSLGRMNTKTSVPALREALKDKDVGVILAAASFASYFGRCKR